MTLSSDIGSIRIRVVIQGAFRSNSKAHTDQLVYERLFIISFRGFRVKDGVLV